MSNIFENRGAFAATIVVAASNSLNQAAANYVCDGAADDVEINAALAALPAANGRVLLLEGTYTTVANITVPANATLEGQGKATIITPTGAAITNGIILNGNNITLKDMKVILAAGAGAGGTRPNIVYASGKILLWLENLWLVGDATVADDGSDLRQNGIYFITCTYCKIVSCQSQGNMRRGISLTTTSENSIVGNTCYGNFFDGISLITASRNNTIVGNICQGNTANGIYLVASLNNAIAGNICQGNTGSGIYIAFVSPSNTVTGNTCSGNNRGISVFNSNNNTIAGNTCQGSTNYGIYFEATCYYNTVTGNTCQGNGGHNIYILRSSYNVITGNSANTSGAGDGIRVEGTAATNSDYNTITGNVCTGNASDGIEIAVAAPGQANKNIVVANQLLGNGVAFTDAGTLTEIGHNITV